MLKLFFWSESLIREDKIRLMQRINFLKSEFQEIEFFKRISQGKN